MLKSRIPLLLLSLVILVGVLWWGFGAWQLNREMVIFTADSVAENELVGCVDAGIWAATHTLSSAPENSQINQVSAFQAFQQLKTKIQQSQPLNISSEFPEFALYLANYGEQCRRDGNFSSAQTWLEHAIALDPQKSVIWYYLGQTYDAQENYATAVDAFEQANTINQDWGGWLGQPYVSAHRSAQLRYQADEYEQAIVNAQLAIQQAQARQAFNKDNWQYTYFVWGESLHKLGRTEEATEVFQEALQTLDGDYPLESHFQTRIHEYTIPQS